MIRSLEGWNCDIRVSTMQSMITKRWSFRLCGRKLGSEFLCLQCTASCTIHGSVFPAEQKSDPSIRGCRRRLLQKGHPFSGTGFHRTASATILTFGSIDRTCDPIPQ